MYIQFIFDSLTTIVNSTNSTSSTDSIGSIVKYYIILGFASILLSWIASTTWIIAAERQVRRMRFALFRNILRQEIGWFDVNNPGELSNRLIGDLGKRIDQYDFRFNSILFSL
jgi:ATP-binding cassette subfamily B (MDR/TAP) protein 1